MKLMFLVETENKTEEVKADSWFIKDDNLTLTKDGEPVRAYVKGAWKDIYLQDEMKRRK